MILDKCALVITSSVYVTAPYTVLLDPEQRVKQYIDSISFFIEDSPLTKIIVCDNSNYKYPASLYDLAASHNKKIELLSFSGSNKLVADHGKGYGEGEILKFVMSNSILIKEAVGFLKVTGRLKVINIDKVLKDCNHWENYFNPISLLRPRFLVPKEARPCVEVRVYYATTDFFRNVLLDAYTRVRDKNKYFLEHAYHEAIASSSIKVKCFSTAPEITGMSGSNGWIFKERSGLKKKLIKLVSFLGYIKPVYKPSVTDTKKMLHETKKNTTIQY